MTTFQTPGPIAAVIQPLVGEINVTASDRSDSVVIVRPRDESNPRDVEAAANALVEFANGVLTVKVVKRWQRYVGPGKNDGSIIVEVELPTGSSLTATTGLGLIRAEGELGLTVVKTGMGDVRLDRVGTLTAKSGFGDIFADTVGGDARVSTGSGTVRLGAVAGSAIVKNSNGIVELELCGGDSHIRTASGNITIGRAAGSVTVGSAAGDINIAELSAGSANLRTGAGAVQIGVLDGSAAWLDVKSGYGSVRNGLTPASGPGESDATVQVRARTGAGDIIINRASAA